MAEKIEQRSVSVKIDGQEIENSLRSITSEMQKLRNMTNAVAEGTDEYITKALGLAQADEAAKKNRESVKAIADAWKRMPEEVKESVKQVQGELNKLEQQYKTLMKGGADKASPQVQLLTQDITRLQGRLAQTVAVFANIDDVAEGSLERLRADILKANKEMEKATMGSEEYYRSVAKIRKLNDELKEHQQRIGDIEEAWHQNVPAVKAAIAAAAGMFAIDQVVQYGRELYKTGSEIDNIGRKSVVVLKEQLAAVNREAKENARDIGLAREQYVGLATDVTAFLQSQKFSRMEAAKMSTEIVNLSGVLAQFKGGGLAKSQEALEAIKAAFAEDVEQLAKFNIAISENVVQAKMQELGLDKANAAAQQHGRAMIILKMITEGATAQNEAFAGSADGMVRSQARVDAMLMTIKNNLAKIFIPIFEELLGVITPVIEGFGEIAEGLSNMVNPSKAASEAFYDQKEKVTALEKKLPDLLEKYDHLSNKSKLSKKEQVLLKDVIVQIGEVVPTAKVEVDNYGKALSINAAAAREFMKAQKTLSEYLNADAISAEERNVKQLQYQQQLAKSRIEEINTGKIVGTSGFFGVDYTKDVEAKTKAVAEWTNKLNQASKTLEGAEMNLKRLRGEPLVDKVAPDNVDMSGSSPADKKREDETKKHLERLAEAVKGHRADLIQQEMRDDERDEARIREKYRKDIELAIETGKLRSKAGAEARQYTAQLEELQEQEIAAKKKENAEKIIQDLQKLASKYAIDQSELALTELEKKLKTVRDKFKDEFAKVAETEKSNDPSVKEQAQLTRLELEKAQNAQLEAERDRHLLEMAKKQEENWRNVQLATATDEEQEVLRVIFHYQSLIDLNQQNHETVKTLVEAQAREIAEIRTKHRSKDLKDEADTAKKVQQIQKDIAIGQARAAEGRFENMKLFGSLVGEVLGETAKKSLAYLIFSKGLAAAEIIMTAQREAAAIRLGYALQATQAAAIPFVGPALAAGLKATGEVLATQATTRGFLNAGIVLAQGVAQYRAQNKYDGGPVIGEQDGRTYNPYFAGEARSGLVHQPTLFLTGEKGTEYVIAGPELKMPEVANFIPFIESRRRARVRGYEDGGAVSDSAGSVGTSSGISTPSVSGQMDRVLEGMLEVLLEMKRTLNRGVGFTFEHMEEFEKMQNMLNEVRK
jgi:DNA repair exonuclease SbcCD ATPase subunit